MRPFNPARFGNTAALAGSSFIGALDAYSTGLMAVWSVSRRLLVSHSTALIRIRVDTGGAPEYDIGFDATGGLDTTDLVAKAAGNAAFITTIYDQSGQGRHFVQSTAASQRRCISGGSVETLGGRPCATATATGQGYATATFTTYTGTTLSAFLRAATDAGVGYPRFLSFVKNSGVDYATSGNSIIVAANSSTELVTFRALSIIATRAGYTSGNVISSIYTGATGTLRTAALSSSGAATAAFDSNKFIFGENTSTGHKWAEAAVYSSDQTSNDTALRAALAA